MDNSQDVRGDEKEAFHSPHHIPQTLVVVGTETAVFNETSSVRRRILASIEAFRDVHVIVLCGGNFPTKKVGDHIVLYPTNSRGRWKRIFDAARIGRALPSADIVTVQDPFETGIAGWLIARRLRALLHVQVHTDFLSPTYARLSMTNFLRRLLAGFVLRRADRVRVVSERIKRSIAARYQLRAPISVLPIFVDIARFQDTLSDAALEVRFAAFKTKFLVVSRLELEKNVSLVLHAFKAAAPPDACLIIVGEGRERDALARLADELEIAHFVFFEDRKDPAMYYAVADLVLVPSKYEGYGMVIVEALAAGKPVLSIDVGIALEAGAIVTSEEKFADALAQWFKNGPRTGELKNYPYRNFEEYVRAYSEDIAACAEAKKTQ